MKVIFMALCTALSYSFAMAQQPEKFFDATLAAKLQINTTSTAAVKKILGEPGYSATQPGGSMVMQYKSGKNMCIMYFSAEQLLTGFTFSGGHNGHALPGYEKIKLLLANPAKDDLLKALGHPPEIKASAQEILWVYKDGDNTLGLIFRDGNVLYNYAQVNNEKTAFTPASIDFLMPQQTLIAEVEAKLGRPAALYFTNEGEDRMYYSGVYTLRVKAGKNSIVTQFFLEAEAD